MYKDLSLKIITETMESFDDIISEIESKFKYYGHSEFIDELLDIAVEYRKDVMMFLKSLYILVNDGGFDEIQPYAIAINNKLNRLDEIINNYTKTSMNSLIIEEPQSKLYS